MRFDGILFDLDGTLWDAVKEITDAWNKALQRNPGLRVPFTETELRGLMGLPMNEIADRVFPAQPQKQRMALLEECMDVENAYLQDHGAQLYPDVPETLALLHREHRLYIVSNCQCGYIEAFLKAHRLNRYVDGFLCYGDTYVCKGANIKSVIQANGLQDAVYVGDTQGDRDAASYAGIPFVYAAYGFGEVHTFDYKIDRFRELTDIFS